MDGLSLARAIRRIVRHRFTPALILATRRGDESKQQGRASLGAPREAIALGGVEAVVLSPRIAETMPEAALDRVGGRAAGGLTPGVRGRRASGWARCSARSR